MPSIPAPTSILFRLRSPVPGKRGRDALTAPARRSMRVIDVAAPGGPEVLRAMAVSANPPRPGSRRGAGPVP